MGVKLKVIRTATKMREFSKGFIVALTILWFMEAVFGGVVVWNQGYGLESLLDYIGAPMCAGVVGYLAKAALENREKVKKSSARETEETKGEDHP